MKVKYSLALTKGTSIFKGYNTTCTCVCSNEGNGAEGLARLGAKTALSFAFAFLRRAWRSGEDRDLCTEVLQQALDILHGLPVPSLFNSSDISNVWLDTVDQCMVFLKSVCCGYVL